MSNFANIALGLGRFCVALCRGNQMPCRYEPSRRLCDLGPYDHLRRMYRLCAFHFKRNVQKLRTVVSPNVYNAMLCISSFEAHPNFETTLQLIRKGGKKAKGTNFCARDTIITNTTSSLVGRQRGCWLCHPSPVLSKEPHASRDLEGFTNYDEQQ